MRPSLNELLCQPITPATPFHSHAGWSLAMVAIMRATVRHAAEYLAPRSSVR